MALMPVVAVELNGQDRNIVVAFQYQTFPIVDVVVDYIPPQLHRENSLRSLVNFLRLLTLVIWLPPLSTKSLHR